MLIVASAILPILQAWVGKLIVDTIVNSINHKLPLEKGLQSVFPFLLFEFMLISLGMVITSIRTLLEHILNARLDYSITKAVINKTLELDLQYFENPVFYDKLQNTRGGAGSRAMSTVLNSFQVVQNFVTLASSILILLTFSLPIALSLFVITIPSLITQIHFSNRYFDLINSRASEIRRKQYLEYLLTLDSTVKEIKLFGLGKPLLKRYDDLFWKLYNQDLKLVRRRNSVGLLWELLTSVNFYIAYAWIVWQTLAGSISLGDMTFYLVLFRQSQSTFQNFYRGIGNLYEGSLFVKNLISFLALKPLVRSVNNPRDVPCHITQGIEFRDVSFRYSDCTSWIIRNLNLHIKPGEKIALVGANGSGKTTLVKLLTRLYDPTEGKILLDGIDIREYNLDELHKRFGVIFQDFVRYQFRIRDNISFGQINAIDDELRIREAAKKAGAEEMINELPNGYETTLGNWFEDGQELSGGQWQRVALGRAFMRDAEVLILDEPTAALDAKGEYDIFQQLHKLTEGKITLLISHRFSTVRMADRIAVLEEGLLSELGSHQELLALNGTYAQLFRLQAEGYN